MVMSARIGGGVGRTHFFACLSRQTIDLAFLLGRSTVATTLVETPPTFFGAHYAPSINYTKKTFLFLFPVLFRRLSPSIAIREGGERWHQM